MSLRVALILTGVLLVQGALAAQPRRAAASAASQFCDDGMNLVQVIDRGRKGAKIKKKPRKAIAECFAPYFDSQAFQTASVLQEEVFLFEYLQACQLAAKDEVKGRYYREAAKVAKFYVTWYPTREKRLQPEYQRITLAAFQLGDAYAELLEWSTLLKEYDELARSHAAYLSEDRTLLNWYKALRSEGVTTERDLEEVKGRIREEPEHRDDWQLFLKTATTLRKGRRYSKELRNALQFARLVTQ